MKNDSNRVEFASNQEVNGQNIRRLNAVSPSMPMICSGGAESDLKKRPATIDWIARLPAPPTRTSRGKTGKRGMSMTDRIGPISVPLGEGTLGLAETPWGVRALSAVHAMGALACLVVAAGCGLSESFRLSLFALSGSALMMGLFGRQIWIFLLVIVGLLSILYYGSRHLRWWAWPLTLICYSTGVIGGLWELTENIPAGFLAASINAGLVAYTCTGRVRWAYGEGDL